MLYVITLHEPSSARKAKAGNSGTDSSKDSHHSLACRPKERAQVHRTVVHSANISKMDRGGEH